MREHWKTYPECTRYQASNLGRVKGPSGKILSALIERHRGGYRSVLICFSADRHERRRVGRMVCTTFHGDPPSAEHQVDHRNKRVTDDRACNLHWITAALNRAQVKSRRGEAHGMVKLSEADVRAVRSLNTTLARIASAFSVSPALIHKIKTRKIWRHIT